MLFRSKKVRLVPNLPYFVPKSYSLSHIECMHGCLALLGLVASSTRVPGRLKLLRFQPCMLVSTVHDKLADRHKSSDLLA